MSAVARVHKYAPLSTLVLVLLPFLTVACGGTDRLVRRDMAGLAWLAPASPSQQRTLARWRAGVGPPLIRRNVAAAPRFASELTVVSWNTAVGEGDIAALVRDVRTRYGSDGPLVLLLQEVYRRGADVPLRIEPGASVAGRLGTRTPGTARDVDGLASALGLNVYYAPSMRNGGPPDSDEDRGNAILSNLPLSDLSAIELPFERQRRVAVAATVTGHTAAHGPWHLRVVSVHLDNMTGARRLWIAGAEFGRVRQIRAVLETLDDEPLAVLGGDLNTWFGFADAGYRTAAHSFPGIADADRRATFRGLLRLDHLFFRLPGGWRAAYRRGDRRYGSDHYPLVARIRVG